MAWRDRLLRASYRGAAFHVAAHTSEAAGRRVAVHEYPGRDLPYAEDVGRRTSEYTLQAYVLGPDYDVARDALVAACALPGAGRLVHPTLGERQVVCTGCTVSERSDEGGMARVTLALVEAGEARYPAATPDTAAALAAAAEGAGEALVADTAAGWPLVT